jgi:hypothetical protein
VGREGPKVPRNFLRVLHAGAPPQIPDGQSGRLQLADWMASDSNALLDRVIVNRIWGHLFGRGIVASVDNFGRLGTPPTHAELLDYLASSFRSRNGSVKSLIRELVLSRAYQLSSDPGSKLAEADPENKWFGRQNRRRLTAEEIRDGILFFSGQLDRQPGLATATSHGIDLDKPFSFAEERKRTVYLPVARNNLAAELSVFDAANPISSRATVLRPPFQHRPCTCSTATSFRSRRWRWESWRSRARTARLLPWNGCMPRFWDGFPTQPKLSGRSASLRN